MKQSLDIYHGSTEIVNKPSYGLGRRNNDYGQGFYCTKNEELAKEWACSSNSSGYANHYKLDTADLKILNINTEEYNILNWMAVLVQNRRFGIDNPVAGRAKRFLLENYMINIKAYDLVIGYRADDAYYDFADSFLNNAITIEQLARAMRLGKLGEQIVLVSEYAFEKIEFAGCSFADNSLYYPKRKERLDSAIQEYLKIVDEDDEGMYLSDILRGGVKKDDPRIPRNTP